MWVDRRAIGSYVIRVAAGLRSSRSADRRGIARLDLRLYWYTMAQGLQNNTAFFRGGDKHCQLFAFHGRLGLQPHAAAHVLEANGNRTLDQQAPSHVAFRVDRD